MIPAEKLRDLKPFIPGEIDDYPFLLLEHRLFFRVARRGKGGCFDSLATLAAEFHVSERTITRTFRVLTFCGAVVRLDHPARYEARPFCEWARPGDLDKIRAEVWGKAPRRRTRRKHALSLVPTSDILTTGEKSNRLRCPDRPSPVSQSAQTPGTDEVTPISEVRSLKGVKAHTPVVENSFEQKPKARRQDPEVIRLYRRFCRQAPNYHQRQEIIAKVTDTRAWEIVLRQFVLEGQNPSRVDWLFERYLNEIDGSDFPDSVDADQPMKTLQQRMIESGELRVTSDYAPVTHPAPAEPEARPLKSRGEFSESETERAGQVLREHVFKTKGVWLPADLTCKQIMEMMRTDGGVACPA